MKFIVLLCLCVCSCKKYENGPVFSLRTKINRLNGTWISQHQILWSGYLPVTGLKGPALIPIDPKEIDSKIIFLGNEKFLCYGFKRFGVDTLVYNQIPNFAWHDGIGGWSFTSGIWGNGEQIEYLKDKEGLELRFEDGKIIKSKIGKLTHKELWLWVIWELGPSKAATILYKWEKKE